MDVLAGAADVDCSAEVALGVELTLAAVLVLLISVLVEVELVD